MANARRKPPELPKDITPHPHAKYTLSRPKGVHADPPYQPALKDRTLSSAQWQNLVETLRSKRRWLLRIPGVTAVDIGYKLEEKTRTFTNEIALRVHVERKLPRGCFKGRQHDFINPDDFAVPIDVIEADYKPLRLVEPPRPRMVFETPRKEANRRRRLDPLVGGISIGSPQTPSGTLGALVWDNKDGSVCILSNWHVLSGDLQAEAGAPCFQPGRFDQGRSSDVVARLKRWSFDRRTDAAIAELTGSRHYCAGEIVDMFQQISGVTDPYLGMLVLKSGRSTGLTWGFVDGLYFSSAIQYGNGVVQVFEEQIHIAPAEPDVPISEGGDSGSVWVTETANAGYKAVGLHFAGDLPRSAFGEYALANPMNLVAKSLDFSFRPRYLEIRDEDAQIQTMQSPMPIQFPMPVHFPSSGNGVHPVGLNGSGLNGSSGQPDPIVINPTGG